MPDGRSDFTAIAVGRFGHPARDVAELLKKNPGTVSRWLTKADRRSQQDPAYQSYLDTLETKITTCAAPKVTK